MPLHAQPPLPDTREWRLDDARGGYASGTATGVLTRRDQALSTAVRDGRVFVLVNALETWLTTPGGRFAISSHRFTPGVLHPDGAFRLQSFAAEPWPRRRFRLDDGTHVDEELMCVKGSSLVALRWSLADDVKGVSIEIRPLLSGREAGALHKENPRFDFRAEIRGWRATWRPYAGVPEIALYSNAKFAADPHWYHNFLYEADGGVEDLASPGVFRCPLSIGTPVELVLAGGGWDEVVSGMILPEHPVLWPAGAPAPAAPAKQGKRGRSSGAKRRK